MLEILLEVLVMLLATNGAPVLAARLFQSHGDKPLDLGKRLADGYPLFGSSKTWRGLLAALAGACALSMLFGYGLWFGLAFGLLVMAGDLGSSFVKRRKSLEPGARCIGWDQVPESLAPSIFATVVLGGQWWWPILLSLTFTLIQMLVSRPLYVLHIRKKPY
ncbi:MAG: CDP-archaeol synthase [Halieaceae bacterium]|jgi:CDP-2,3-bis-(O-geranylgeranyl)-sn-glycerol synthase|nr:CDP-archaeol synthase [Halieaceae bacterium]